MNMSLSKHTLEQSFKEKSVVLIEDHFGYHDQLTRKDEAEGLTTEQKKMLTSVIFNDPDVIKQLSQAELDRQNDISTYSDDEEEFARLLTEVTRGIDPDEE